jgi:hypothetical protein
MLPLQAWHSFLVLRKPGHRADGTKRSPVIAQESHRARGRRRKGVKWNLAGLFSTNERVVRETMIPDGYSKDRKGALRSGVTLLFRLRRA